jgi:hypothetical protein
LRHSIASESVRLSHVKSEMVQPTVFYGDLLGASSLERGKADVPKLKGMGEQL